MAGQGHDAGSKLIENIFASIADHDRVKNLEQSKSRTIARLLNGFWVFKAPRLGDFRLKPRSSDSSIPSLNTRKTTETAKKSVSMALHGF